MHVLQDSTGTIVHCVYTRSLDIFISKHLNDVQRRNTVVSTSDRYSSSSTDHKYIEDPDKVGNFRRIKSTYRHVVGPKDKLTHTP